MTLISPPVIFGTSCLGNLYRAIPMETKTAIAAEWFKAYPKPVIDSAGKYGAGLALECIGKALRALGKKPGEIAISVKLGWRRKPLETPEPTFEPGAWADLAWDARQDISYDGILRCYEEAKDLLGGYPIDLVSVHDPDEYLAAFPSRREDVLGAYRALFELKAAGEVKGVGIGSKDWTVIRDLAGDVPFDWAMFACAPTVLRHPPELLAFIADLAAKGVAVIDSAVFNGGFLTGGDLLDYRPADPVADARLFAVRNAYLKLCTKFALDPAAVAVEYALRIPGVRHVALNTSQPGRVAVNAAYGAHRAPEGFWNELKEII
ncbi:MAG: aldo/keto reductase [Kiritimatiellia bacterium]